MTASGQPQSMPNGGLWALKLAAKHVLISGCMAPALGGIVWSFFASDWSARDCTVDGLIDRFMRALILGCCVTFFIAPVTIAVGVVSYITCFGLVAYHFMSQRVWCVGAALVGGAFGALAFHQEGGCAALLMGLVGVLIGSGTGVLFHALWSREICVFLERRTDALGSTVVADAGGGEERL